MHDIVSHRVSLMVLQAGALRITAPDDATGRAAEEIRAAGCQALEELRDLMTVLRRASPAEGAGPSPEMPASIPNLASLAAESEAVGVPVDLVSEGSPSLASPVVGRTAYRVVQEALTNVRKHAPSTRVRVQVSHTPDRIRVTVTNTSLTRRPDAGLASTGSGSGLLGLWQRVELIGGTLVAGPNLDGGFEVVADLPAYVPTGV